MNLDETAGLDRPPEPVEVLLSCPSEQAVSLAREVRVARVMAGGVLREVPCQTHGEVRRGAFASIQMSELHSIRFTRFLARHGACSSLEA